VEFHLATLFTSIAAPLFWVVSFLGNFKPLDFIITRAVFALLGALLMTVAGVLYRDVGILLAEIPFIFMNSFGIWKGIQLRGGLRRMSYILPDYDILNYFASVETIDYNLKLLGVHNYWNRTKGEGIGIAIIDTGIDTDHPDLQPNVKLALDFTHENNPEDLIGHGTHCAGILAGCDNGVGIIGVAPRANLFSLKVIAKDKGNSRTLAQALRWVVNNHKEHQIKIVSMSLGSNESDYQIEKILHEMKSLGLIVICAAGNAGEGSSTRSTISFPARLAANGLCISVGAVDAFLGLAGFSSTGANGEVTFVSPGVDIYSTYLNGQYIKLSGTSMATPALAGFVALILATHPEIDTLDEVVAKLKQLTKSLGPIEKFGFGMPRIRPDLM